MQSTTTSAPIAHAFDPQDWLIRFEAAGGGYAFNAEGKLDLGFLYPAGSSGSGAKAKQMLDSLTADQVAQVRAHLLAEPTTDDAAKRRWARMFYIMKQADAAYDAFKRAIYGPAEERYEAWFVERGASCRPGAAWATPQMAELRNANPHAQEWDLVTDRLEELTDEFCAAEDALMETPAPGLPELAWKLNRLLDFNGESSTPAWSRDYVVQTVADCRRLLEGRA